MKKLKQQNLSKRRSNIWEDEHTGVGLLGGKARDVPEHSSPRNALPPAAYHQAGARDEDEQGEVQTLRPDTPPT